MAIPAAPSAAKAEPPLKPNQPTHNIAAPTKTNAGLCGGLTSFGKPFLDPNIFAITKAAIPQFK